MNLLKFLKSRTNQYKIQREIYLTIDLVIDDKVFDNLIDFRKAYISDLIQKYNYDMLVDEGKTELEYLVKELKNIEGNILIGNACYNLNELKLVNSLLSKVNLQINKIFIKSESRRAADLIEGQELYRNHNRWIDFYPGQVEEVHQLNENNLKEIKDYFKGSNVLVVEV